jgi:hypothetical protein
MVTIDPKDRMVNAVADAVSSYTFGYLPDTAKAERT